MSQFVSVPLGEYHNPVLKQATIVAHTAFLNVKQPRLWLKAFLPWRHTFTPRVVTRQKTGTDA